MSHPIENARQTLMACGRKKLVQNRDGRYGRFSLRELTEESGIALGTFYNYFGSKDDFVQQIMDEDWNKVIRQIESIALRNASLYEKVKAIYLEISCFEQNYSLSVMMQMKQSGKAVEHRKKNEQMAYDLAEKFLREEIDRGELKLQANVESAAYFLMQLFFAAGRNPKVDFDELWKCMNFRYISGNHE